MLRELLSLSTVVSLTMAASPIDVGGSKLARPQVDAEPGCVLDSEVKQQQAEKGDKDTIVPSSTKASLFRFEVVRSNDTKTEEVSLAPGFYESATETFHRWKGIIFRADELPMELRSPYRRVLTISPQEVKYTVKDYDPSFSYLHLEEEKTAVGYYSRAYNIFYRWKGIILKSEEIPDHARETPERIFQSGRFKGYVIVVDPPKHIFDKPELWKKVTKAD